MNESVHLIGAEEVARAASRMQAAAEDMKRAAMSIDGTAENFIRQIRELVERVEVVNSELQASLMKRT